MQASEPDVILPSTCAARRVVVVGDHKQLGQQMFFVFVLFSFFQSVIRQDKKKAQCLLTCFVLLESTGSCVGVNEFLCRTRGA